VPGLWREGAPPPLGASARAGAATLMEWRDGMPALPARLAPAGGPPPGNKLGLERKMWQNPVDAGAISQVTAPPSRPIGGSRRGKLQACACASAAAAGRHCWVHQSNGRCVLSRGAGQARAPRGLGGCTPGQPSSSSPGAASAAHRPSPGAPACPATPSCTPPAPSPSPSAARSAASAAPPMTSCGSCWRP
jgi:hypothetical protein